MKLARRPTYGPMFGRTAHAPACRPHQRGFRPPYVVFLAFVTLAIAFPNGVVANIQTSSGEAHTADLYVSETGSDGNPGTEAKPLRTVSKALEKAEGKDTILVASGIYPPVYSSRVFSQTVTVKGTGPSKPIIQYDAAVGQYGAIELWGAQNVALEGLEVRGGGQISGGGIFIADSPTEGLKQPSANITIRNDKLGDCEECAAISVRNGASNVIIEDNYIHDSQRGITTGNYRFVEGPGKDNGKPDVTGVVVRHNVLERFTEDAVQFADWENAVIDGNVMRHAHHDPLPAEQFHNDLIQFTGNSSHIVIANNVLGPDSQQEIFIQPAFGPISDVLVENNVLWGASGFPVQAQAVSGLRFLYNTVWDSYGAFVIRGMPEQLNPDEGEPPTTDAVVKGNILAGLNYAEGASAAVEDYNLIYKPGRKLTSTGIHDIVGQDPLFTDAESGDFRIQPSSPGVGGGDPEDFPPADQAGFERRSPPSVGAYEVALPAETSSKDAAEPEKPLSPPDTVVDPQAQEPAATGAHTPWPIVRMVLELRFHNGGVAVGRRWLRFPSICRPACTADMGGQIQLTPKRMLHFGRRDQRVPSGRHRKVRLTFVVRSRACLGRRPSSRILHTMFTMTVRSPHQRFRRHRTRYRIALRYVGHQGRL